MTETCSVSRKLRRRMAIAVSVLAFTAASYPALAQSDDAAQTVDAGHAYSTSTDWKAYLDTDSLVSAATPTPSAAAGQYGGRSGRYPGYDHSNNVWSHLAFEAGGGFTAPIGNQARDGYETWGYNVGFGAGWNFTKRIGALLEYQFNKQKIPGSTLTQLALDSDSGTPLGGNINTWSLTIDPIIYQPITKKFGGYITGGGGFYRKVTNFTAPELEEDCYYFCYEGYVPATVAHSSSNQGGLNLGVGLYWKVFGEDSNAKFYAESRYVWVNSPDASVSDPYGTGTEGFIPVTFGVRF